MVLKGLRNRIAKIPGQVSLQSLIVVPFVLLIGLAIGLTGYFSYLNSQQTVSILAEQLQQSATDRIVQHLADYLKAPKQINQINLTAAQQGLLPLDDLDASGLFLGRQMRIFNVSYIAYCKRSGEFIGLERLNNGNLLWNEITPAHLGRVDVYAINDQGKQGRKVTSRPWEPRDEVWYSKTVQEKVPSWSPIYQWEDKPEILSVSANYPLLDQDREVLGVFSVDLVLSHIQRFLASLHVTASGVTFILDRDGQLVASSLDEPPYQLVDGKATRLKAIKSREPKIRYTVATLNERLGDLSRFQGNQTLTVNFGRDRWFAQITTYRDDLGLDWLIGVVIPETDFLSQMQDSQRTIVMLCLLALGLAAALSWLASRWFVRPIRQLTATVTHFTQGDWNQMVPVSRLREVNRLAQAFQQMASQLQASFTELQEAKASLEDRVEARTAEMRASNRQLLEEVRERKKSEMALRQAEEKYRGIVENAVEGIFQATLDGKFISANLAMAKIYKYESPEDLMNSISHVGRQLYVQPTRRAELAAYLQRFDEVSDFESEMYCKDGSIIWISEDVRVVRDGTGQVLYYEGSVRNVTDRKLAEEELRRHRWRAERLLLNILPQPIAERLKRGQQTIADSFSDVSVLFADIVGFTQLSSNISPIELVGMLNHVFSVFDSLAEEFGLEKIKTIGDAYMVVSGLPNPRPDAVEAIADMALEMLAAIHDVRTHNHQPIQIRIGIHTGTVVAGVIGVRKFIYDLWGDTVNVASRMETQGEPGRIQVTQELYEQLKHKYRFEERGEIDVKGKGMMPTYWLIGRQPGWAGTVRYSDKRRKRKKIEDDRAI